MTFLTYIFSFLTLISIIVFIHELGHFFFARLFGVRVLDFSIGFGKSIKSWQTKSKTIFNLRILPFGGYVKMNGEEISKAANNNDSYLSKKYYQKLLITLGGPIFNFILAIIIFFMINLYGVYKVTPVIGDIIKDSKAETSGLLKDDLIVEIDKNKISSYSDAQLMLSKRLGDTGEITFKVKRNASFYFQKIEIEDWLSTKEPSNLLSSLGILPPIEPIVGTVVNSSPAEKSGIKQGDKILEINNSIVNNWTDIKNLVNEANGQEISLKLLRKGNVDVLKVKPKLSENNFNWQIGISAAYILSPESREFIRYGFLDAFKNSISQTYSVIENSIIFIGKIMFGQVSAKNLGGPVMIGQYAGESVIYGGFYSFIYLIAFISISLGIVNLFPLPVLDGGQALILTIEKILGRDLPAQLLDFSNKIGTLLLLFLFIFVFFNDIFRIVA